MKDRFRPSHKQEAAKPPEKGRKSGKDRLLHKHRSAVLLEYLDDLEG